MKNKNQQKKKQDVHVFPHAENQCIWMKAGVVNFKLCDNAYDCLTCPFDKAMSRAIEQKSEKVVSWRQVMQNKKYNQKECRHMLTGRVQFRLCANSYQCHACEFDQALAEKDIQDAPAVTSVRKVSGFDMADNHYYHRGHTWARVEHGGFVRVGIDDFALRLLGRPSDIRLPKLGSQLEQTEVGWTLERDDKEAPMLAPVNGVVMATNYKVLEQPDAAKKDPYGQGWLLVIEPRNLRQSLKNLLFNQEAAIWLGSEAQKLEAMVMNSYGMSLAATGGEMVDDIFGNLPDMKWEDLVHEFLLT